MLMAILAVKPLIYFLYSSRILILPTLVTVVVLAVADLVYTNLMAIFLIPRGIAFRYRNRRTASG